jgi:hypothetical protein
MIPQGENNYFAKETDALRIFAVFVGEPHSFCKLPHFHLHLQNCHDERYPFKVSSLKILPINLISSLGEDFVMHQV